MAKAKPKKEIVTVIPKDYLKDRGHASCKGKPIVVEGFEKVPELKDKKLVYYKKKKD